MFESVTSTLNGLIWPLTRLFNLADPFSVVSLATAALLALGYITVSCGGRPAARLVKAVRSLFPPGTISHPSTALDMKLYFVNGVLFGTALASWIIGSDVWRGWAETGLDAIFGAPPQPFIPAYAAQGLATLVGIVAFDLGYYVAHWLVHHFDFLWRFHRPHHTAEVMTPLTANREHPVDMLFFSNVIAFFVGVGSAGLERVIGGGAGPYLLFQTNCLLFVYIVTLQHLRHSHLWLPFSGVLGYFLQSPAHHQIHHSTNPTDHGSNLGFSLSIFDALFGTLRLPLRRERLQFGLEAEGGVQNLRAFYFKPFESTLPALRSLPASPEMRAPGTASDLPVDLPSGHSVHVLSSAHSGSLPYRGIG